MSRAVRVEIFGRPASLLLDARRPFSVLAHRHVAHQDAFQPMRPFRRRELVIVGAVGCYMGYASPGCAPLSVAPAGADLSSGVVRDLYVVTNECLPPGVDGVIGGDVVPCLLALRSAGVVREPGSPSRSP